MSLQGSLDTFALPDVLRLLASTNKTGELQVKTRRIAGQIWVRDGEIVGGAVGEIQKTVDVVFELLRSQEGSFSFVNDRPAARPSDPLNVDAVLFDVEERLIEWREIEAIIPSVHAKLSLAREVEGTVVVTPEEWAEIACIGSGATVSEVMKALDTGEFITCKRLKHLVELNVVSVGVPDGDDSLFEEPETDVSFLSPDVEDNFEAKEKSTKGADKKKAHSNVSSLDDARAAQEKPADGDAEAVARWDEIRRLAKIDDEGADEELTPEEQERAKELIEAHGEQTPKGDHINRGDLLKLLASAQTSA